ncbi:MAG: lysine exporter LysO family protein [Clostridium sp.]|nr:lysine exporter LysO family protein [Clostridium sp.]
MVIVILSLWGSAGLGYLLRRHPQAWVSLMLLVFVWLLLFIIGIEVGSNRQLIQSMGNLGFEAAVVTFVTTLCCGIATWMMWRWINVQPATEIVEKKMDAPRRKHRYKIPSLSSLWNKLRDSLIILCCFLAGCLVGLQYGNSMLPSQASFVTLCLMMACVGFNIGQNSELRNSFRRIKKKLILLPLVTIGATWVGSALTALLLPRHGLTDWLAVGSGFGYYSLSGIIITQTRGAELGTIALMYNILREISALLFSPLLFRLFGPLSPISTGGATTADTTLPVIARVCGEKFIPISVYHGLTVDFTVPFLVPFFCSLA